MSDIKITANDVLLAVAALIVVSGLAALIIFTVFFLFAFGSPLLLVGYLTGLGVLGIIFLFGILVAFVSLWYVIYFYLKSGFEGKVEKPQKQNYTLDRIKKTQP